MIYREICSFVKCLIYVYEINKMFVFYFSVIYNLNVKTYTNEDRSLRYSFLSFFYSVLKQRNKEPDLYQVTSHSPSKFLF